MCLVKGKKGDDELDDDKSEMLKYYANFHDPWEPRLDFMQRNTENICVYNEAEDERKALNIQEREERTNYSNALKEQMVVSSHKRKYFLLYRQRIL